MNFEIKIDENLVKAEFNRIINLKTKEKINNLFTDKYIYENGKQSLKTADGNFLIREHIDKKLKSLETEEFIQQYVEKHWKRILEEATEKALKHKANAIAFKGITR